MKNQQPRFVTLGLVCLLFAFGYATESRAQTAKTRIDIVGLDHDHVWGLLKDIANEPQAELVAIAEANPGLVEKAKAQVPATIRFYPNYVQMLADAKPAAVFVT